MRRAFSIALLLALPACQKADETPAPVPMPGETEAPVAPSPSPSASATSALDSSALSERKDPEKLLAYLATAIGMEDWDAAALAWHNAQDGSKMTGAKAKALFGDPQSPLITFGAGQQDGAAGSLYYEAPVLLLAKSGRGREGTLTLRRVNDVDGAEDWQLAWHVEQLAWKN